MTGDSVFLFLPILFYIAPVIFVIWFMIKFLKVQQEKNKILRTISDKLDKLNQTGKPVTFHVTVCVNYSKSLIQLTQQFSCKTS